MPGTTCHGFAVERRETVPELDSDAYVLRHTASGARLLYLACDDENKAFAIGFKTPPADSTGVFHILEHSVLCGSAKFPVKEPFVDLIKSSMQTFLNAMTYPDKTIYPVATTNEQDLSESARKEQSWGVCCGRGACKQRSEWRRTQNSAAGACIGCARSASGCRC